MQAQVGLQTQLTNLYDNTSMHVSRMAFRVRPAAVPYGQTASRVEEEEKNSSRDEVERLIQDNHGKKRENGKKMGVESKRGGNDA